MRIDRAGMALAGEFSVVALVGRPEGILVSTTRKLSWLASVGAGAWLAGRIYRSIHGYDFRNKVVLISGGSRGLGLVLGRQLAREGARLVICARDREELGRAVDDLAARGARVMAVPCDVTDRAQVECAVRSAAAHFGAIDVLINNAGTIAVGPVEAMTREDYETALQTHFWGPLTFIEAVLPGMRERGQGRIVNIASIGGKVSVPHLIPYCASKFALVGLSEGLRAELGKDGIVVTTVCPGLMRTGSPPNAFFKGRYDAEYAWFAIGDSLPGLTISAETAARRIVRACKRGDAEVVLGLPAQCAALLHGVFPGLTADLLGFVNRLLPAPGGIGTEHAVGKDSKALTPSWLTALSDRAARRNNELTAP